MDNLRGHNDIDSDDIYDNEAIETPPVIPNEERRMQVRAYNYWVSLLGNRCLPSIEDLNPEELEDFSANSVLLDFSMGLENPAIIYLGTALREECGIDGAIERIDDVPSRSLLSRLTDHYLQIIANAAPVGFEAEFTNQRGTGIMYRGILMPFSSDDETIDFIYGVINWKEVASESITAQLGEEMKAALDAGHTSYPDTPIWADGPSATSDFEDEGDDATDDLEAVDDALFDLVEPEQDIAPVEEDVLDLVDMAPEEAVSGEIDAATAGPDTANDNVGIEDGDVPPQPIMDEEPTGTVIPMSLTSLDDGTDDEDDQPFAELDLSEFLASDREEKVTDAFADFDANSEDGESTDEGQEVEAADASSIESEDDSAHRVLAFIASHDDTTEAVAPINDAPIDIDGGFGGDADDVPALDQALTLARQSASEVLECEARSRTALYRAIGYAHDFALSAQDAPDAYAAMLDNAGISVQERSPMTAVIKLVFGADYDKTRIAEYALALDYAVANGFARGALTAELGSYAGGLKGLVQDVRASRKAGEAAPQARAVRRLDRAVRKLNRAKPVDTDSLPFGDLGLAVVVARREEDGSISLIAGVGLEDKAAQKVMVAASKSVKK